MDRCNTCRDNPVPVRVGNLLSHQRLLPRDPNWDSGTGYGPWGGSTSIGDTEHFAELENLGRWRDPKDAVRRAVKPSNLTSV